MANPEIQVDVKLNDADYQRGVKGIQSSAKQLASEFKTLGREISQVSRTLTFFGGAVTASMTATFQQAAKDIPVVNSKLKEIGNSFQALADNVAIAAIPSLNEFSRFLNGTVAVITRFVAEHREFVNQFLKYSAITLVVGTLGFAFAKLISLFADIISLGKRVVLFFAAMNAQVLIVAGTVFALIAGLLVLDRALGGFWTEKINNAFKQMTAQFKSFIKTFQLGMDEIPERSVNAFGKLREGFLSTIKSMNDAMFEFGASISQALEKGFSDTIFNTITGRMNGMRDIMKSLVDDIARGFSRLASNEIMAGLFGDKEGGRRGLFGGVGSLFGRGGGRGRNPLDEAAKKTSRTFEDLTDNMKKFGRAKDDVIDNLKRFGRQIQETGGGMGGGGGGMVSVDITSFEGAGEVVTGLNGILGQTFGLATMIGQAFDGVSKAIIKMGITYGIVQAGMLAISVAASAVMIAIGTVTATALAAVWAVPAILASIATLGGAALIGTAAVAASVASAPGIGMSGVSAGGSQASAGTGFNVGGGSTFDGILLPKGATPWFGAEGGIVTRPTLSIIGEAGPEAVVPLKGKTGRFGGDTSVDIHIDTALLNNPSNMRDFVKMLKEELAR